MAFDIGSDDSDNSQLTLVFFGASEGPVWTLYDQVTNNDAFTFFHTDQNCAKDYQTSAPGLAIIRNFDDPIVPFTGDMTLESLNYFMHDNSIPSVFEFSE